MSVLGLELRLLAIRYLTWTLYVCISMCVCVCVCIYIVKAHLLMATIRSLGGSFSYYILNIHRLDIHLPEEDHNPIKTLNRCSYMSMLHTFLIL